jgi:replicative DNA helicase
MKQITKISTGFTKFDDLVNGLNGGELIIIGARPAIGKTAFATTLSKNIMEQNCGVCFFSLEMSRDALQKRFSKNNINVDHAMFSVIDKARITLNEIKQTIKQQYKEKNLKVFFIDYLKLIDKQCTDIEMIKELKTLAIDLNIVIIILTVLSRSTEGQKPELKYFPAVDSCADIILALYRNREEEKKGNIETDLIVLQNNVNNNLGIVALLFDSEKRTFYEK